VDYDADYDPEEEYIPLVKARARRNVQAQQKKSKPTRKTSYEASADVQRWLREQALEDEGFTSSFNPTFLASQRDSPWILSSLSKFYEEDLITDVLHTVKSGKEASVYCCAASPRIGAKYLAAKVYRPRMFRSLKNDAVYRLGRVIRDDDGQVARGSRHWVGAAKNERGRAAQVSSWIGYEFETLHRVYEAGARVPRPLLQIGNAILMEYIGDVNDPAPLLREVALEQEEAQPLFEEVMRNIECCLACDRIHGDLSEYNILYWDGTVTLIDFAQAVDPSHNPNVFALLLRDIERVCRYFARYGVEADAQALASDLWRRYQYGGM
jgi:RIO kinase 1